MTAGASLSALIQNARERGPEYARGIAEQKAAQTPRRLFLPGIDIGEIGAFPNHLNRSSLIAPIARRARKFHRQAVMVTRRDCVLEYTGEQLDEADGDLIMALIALALPWPLGEPVPLNRADLLRKLGRETGKSQYDWLYRSMKRLRECTLFLEARMPNGAIRYTVGGMESFNILESLNYDAGRETYTYALDPRWVVLFSNLEFGLLDWNKRLQIGRGQDMAKALQRLLATSTNLVQRYALDWLKVKMDYCGRMRDFRDALARACKELERLEIVAAYKIEDSAKSEPQLALWLPPSA